MGYKLGEIDRELVAAEAILEIEKGASEREAIRLISQKYKIKDWRIRGSFHSLVFEVTRRLNLIDFLISKSLQKGKITKIYPLLRNLLRVGVYIIKFTKTPPPKITKLVVKLVKEHFRVSVAKFANALLRKIELMNLNELITDSTETLNLSLKYFHPGWFIEYLKDLIGLPETIEFLKKSSIPSQLYIRINELKADLATVVEELKKEEFSFKVDNDLPDVIAILKWKYPIIHSNLYKKGLIYIQGKASALVSHVVDPQNEEIIFDLCAAPGGKSMHMGQLLQNRGRVIALDRSHRRLLELSTKLKDYSLHNIYVIQGVGEKVQKLVREKADKILVDPVCSGTGTLISRPYSKWKLRQKDLQIFNATQWKLLVSAVKLLKEAGEIIYSTCSLTVEENEKIVEKFLHVFSDSFTLVPATPLIGTSGFLGLSKTQRLWPHLHNTEGFFISKLKRK